MIYLADTLSDGKAKVPYVVVAALDPAAPPPLGPFLPKGVKELKDDEIVLAEWPGSPITAKPGDAITLSYYPPEEHGEFKLRDGAVSPRRHDPHDRPRGRPGPHAGGERHHR